MAKDSKINMPSSGGGLVRYFDECESAIQLKPGHIIVLVAIVIILELILHWQGMSLLGL